MGIDLCFRPTTCCTAGHIHIPLQSDTSRIGSEKAWKKRSSPMQIPNYWTKTPALKTRGKSGDWLHALKYACDFNGRPSLHTGEVQGSIPCASTRRALTC